MFDLEIADVFELPDAFLTDYDLKPIRPGQRIRQLRTPAIESVGVDLQPFEVLVFEATQVADGRTYDADAYR